MGASHELRDGRTVSPCAQPRSRSGPNLLAPKLVGESVGLHPVWLIFALLAFGYLFGLVGLLVAVPLAATIGVLARFTLRRYLESSLRTGEKSG